tara:strand:+ start:467 stop:2302 length:1836 start_codon:yes stop_codon:yes gene_type:complete
MTFTISENIGYEPYVFFTGTQSQEYTIPNTIKLANHTYALDLKSYKRSSASPFRDSTVSTNQFDDSLFNTEGAWFRYGYDYSYGAGQLNYDLGADASQKRFFNSVGIDIWDDGLKLLHKTNLVSPVTLPITHGTVYIAVTDTCVFVADSLAIYKSTDLNTWTLITPSSSSIGTIYSITSDGKTCWMSTSNGLWKILTGTSVATFIVSTVYNSIWIVGNYLLGSRDNVLYSIDGTHPHTGTIINPHWQPTFVWKTAFAVGSKIFVGGSSGARSEIYGFTINSSGGLVLGAEVTSLSYGEIINFVLSHVGIVVLCTNRGIRIGNVGADGSISYGPLIDTPGPVSSAQADGKYVWFNWSNIDNTKSGAGRINIATTVNALEPAYATDVYSDAGVDCSAVGRFLDRVVLGITNQGIAVESATEYVAEGVLNSSDIYFGTIEPKTIMDSFITSDPLVSGTSCKISIFDEFSVVPLNELSMIAVGLSSGIVELNGEMSTFFKVRLTLNTTISSVTPKVKKWRIRAYPVPPAVENIILPILLYSKTVINDASGQIFSLNTQEEFNYLKTLWSEKQPVTYFEGESSIRVRIEAFEFSTDAWQDIHGLFEGILVLKLTTV